MVSAKFLGALALFSLGSVEASSSATESSFIETTSAAQPSLSASDVSSSSEDATSTLELSTTFATLISTAATLDDASSTTEGTTTSAAPDTTTTSVDATTSAAATTTAAPPPTPTFRLFTYDSQDPTLNRGLGYCKLEQYQTSQTVFYMKFTPTSAFAPTFKIDPSTGTLTVISGLFSSSGEIMGATTLKGIAPTSLLKIVPEAFVDTGLQELISCSIATDQYNKLVCNWTDGGIADFWTCGGRLMLVRPGYTLGNGNCQGIPYKMSVHAQFM
ncbi:CMGC kinase [Fusarium pseudocircinatum]|uniref:CMGC kinase n=1 Tax=Fusarium pseudocircinatum TaxID=56676 RepID=A0A8H5PJ57_9HYPO|nr:CMGC kinase [Fusarium pseudocircinatum]